MGEKQNYFALFDPYFVKCDLCNKTYVVWWYVHLKCVFFCDFILIGNC